MLAALRAAKARTPKVKLDVSVFQRIDPCVSDPSSAFHQQFADAVRDVRGKKPKWSVVSGFTDLFGPLSAKSRLFRRTQSRLPPPGSQ